MLKISDKKRDNFFLSLFQEDEEIIENFDCNLSKKEKFKKIISILDEMKKQGKLNYEVENDIEIPYAVHRLYISWNLQEEGYFLINKENKSSIRQIIKLADEVYFGDEAICNWQISIKIYYKEAKDEKKTI